MRGRSFDLLHLNDTERERESFLSVEKDESRFQFELPMLILKNSTSAVTETKKLDPDLPNSLSTKTAPTTSSRRSRSAR